MMGPGFGFGGYHMLGGAGFFGGFMMLAFFACVGFGIWALVSYLGRGQHMGHHVPMVPPAPGSGPDDEAIAIAKRRLASGEITSEQYAEIMRALQG